MMQIDQLYQDVILDHNKSPRNFKKIERPTAYSHGYNPLCGDDYHLYLVIDQAGVIQDVGVEGDGCAISKSSASMMTTLIKGKKVEEALKMQQLFYEMLTTPMAAGTMKPLLGKLIIFEGVKKFPVRVKCANLIWRALEDALKGHEGKVTTE